MIITSSLDNGKKEIQTQKPKQPSLSVSLVRISSWIKHIDPVLYSKSKPHKNENILTDETPASIIVDPIELRKANIITNTPTRQKTPEDVQLLSYLFPLMESVRTLNDELTSGTSDLAVIKRKYFELKDRLDQKTKSLSQIDRTPAFRSLHEELRALDQVYNFHTKSEHPITTIILETIKKHPLKSEKNAQNLSKVLIEEFKERLDKNQEGVYCRIILNVLFNKFRHQGSEKKEGEQLSYSLHSDTNLINGLKSLMHEDTFEIETFMLDVFDGIEVMFSDSANKIQDVFLAKLYFIRNMISTAHLHQLPLENLNTIKGYLFKELNSLPDPFFQELLISELANTELEEKEIVTLLELLTSKKFLESNIERQALGELYRMLKQSYPESEFIKQQAILKQTLQQTMSELTHQEMVNQFLKPDQELQLMMWQLIDPITNDQHQRLENSKIGFEIEFMMMQEVEIPNKQSIEIVEKKHSNPSHSNTAVKDGRMEVGSDPLGSTEVRRKGDFLVYNEEYIDDVIQTLQQIRITNAQSFEGGTRLNPIHITLDREKHPEPIKIFDGKDQRNSKDGHESRGHGNNAFASTQNIANSIAFMALNSVATDLEVDDLDFDGKHLSQLSPQEIVFIKYLKRCNPEDFALLYNVFLNSSQEKNKTFLCYPNFNSLFAGFLTDDEAVVDLMNRVNDPLLISIFGETKIIKNPDINNYDQRYFLMYEGELFKGRQTYNEEPIQIYTVKGQDSQEKVIVINNKNLKTYSYEPNPKVSQSYRATEINDKHYFSLCLKEGVYVLIDEELHEIYRIETQERIDSLYPFKTQDGLGVLVDFSKGGYKFLTHPAQSLEETKELDKVSIDNLRDDYTGFEIVEDGQTNLYLPKFNKTIEGIKRYTSSHLLHAVAFRMPDSKYYYYTYPTDSTFGPFDDVEKFGELMITSTADGYQVFDTYGPLDKLSFPTFVDRSGKFCVFRDEDGKDVIINGKGEILIQDPNKFGIIRGKLFVLKDKKIKVIGAEDYYFDDDVVDFDTSKRYAILTNSKGQKSIFKSSSSEEELIWVDEITFDTTKPELYFEKNKGKSRIVDSDDGTSIPFDPNIDERNGNYFVSNNENGNLNVYSYFDEFCTYSEFAEFRPLKGLEDLFLAQIPGEIASRLYTRRSVEKLSDIVELEVLEFNNERTYITAKHSNNRYSLLDSDGDVIDRNILGFRSESGFADIAYGDDHERLISGSYPYSYEKIIPFTSPTGTAYYLGYDFRNQEVKVLDSDGVIIRSYYEETENFDETPSEAKLGSAYSDLNQKLIINQTDDIKESLFINYKNISQPIPSKPSETKESTEQEKRELKIQYFINKFLESRR
ncbi:MAG: hypothetical protein ACRCXZ_05245 [Patescibacteria group bacterium]